MIRKLLILTVIAVLWVSVKPDVQAQDRGRPIFQVIAYYSMIGAVSGAALGSIIWAMDPLNPNTQLTEFLIFGMGIGAPLGLIFGVNKVVTSVRKDIPQDYYYSPVQPDGSQSGPRSQDDITDPNRRYPDYPPQDRYQKPDPDSGDWYDQYDSIIKEDLDYYNYDLDKYNFFEDKSVQTPITMRDPSMELKTYPDQVKHPTVFRYDFNFSF